MDKYDSKCCFVGLNCVAFHVFMLSNTLVKRTIAAGAFITVKNSTANGISSFPQIGGVLRGVLEISINPPFLLSIHVRSRSKFIIVQSNFQAKFVVWLL